MSSPYIGKALVEAADLVEHRAAQQQAGAEHPVALDRRVGDVGEVVPGLRGLDVAHERAQRRAPHERAADRREATARALQRPVASRAAAGPTTPQRGCASAWATSARHSPARSAHVGVEDQDVAATVVAAISAFWFCAKRARPRVDVRADAERARELRAAVRHVLAHERRHAVARERRRGSRRSRSRWPCETTRGDDVGVVTPAPRDRRRAVASAVRRPGELAPRAQGRRRTSRSRSALVREQRRMRSASSSGAASGRT